MPLYKFNPQHFKWPFTAAMLALLIALAIADAATNERLTRICAVRGFDVYYGEWWRMFTGAFMHADWMHIAFNSYALFSLGRQGEQVFGRRLVAQVYFVALFGGSALALVLTDPATPMVGASGAIFGLFGMWIGYFFARTGGIRNMWQTPVGRQLLILLAINMAISLSPRISLWAHVGGLVPGLALGYYHERKQSRNVGWPERASIAVLLVAIAGLSVYACLPFNRPGYMAMQALKAYDRNDIKAGDAWLARSRGRGNVPEGVNLLIDHLRAWRTIRELDDEQAGRTELLLPLMGVKHPWNQDEAKAAPFSYLKLTPELQAAEGKLESQDAAP